MAVRGINPFEKHIEKIFLALAAAGLTGVVAWQFAGAGNTVEVGTEKDVPADQAYGKIESKAKQLQAQMRDANPHTPEALKQSTDLMALFTGRLTGKVAPNAALPYAPAGVVWGKPKADNGGGGAVADSYFLPPVLPATVKPIAHPFMSTVSEGDVTAFAELARFVPAKAPFDKAAVSVETTIDPKAIRAALESDPDGPGPAQALLRAWWAGTEIVAVELVRQERKTDGTWGNEVATPVLPGRKNFAEQLKDPQIDSQTLAQVAFDAATSLEEILRPEWYRRAELGGNVVGEAWVAPLDAAKNESAGGTNGPLDDLNKQLRNLRADQQRLEKQIANVKQQPAPGAGSGGGGAGGGGKRPGGAGGGASSGGGPGTTPKADPKEEQIKTLEKRLEQTKKLIADVEKKIADLGGKSDAATAKPVARDADLSVLLSSTDPINVWHHDVDAVRGATYRYQLRVKLNNPLFNRAGQLKADKADFARSPTIEVPCADWSDPVRVDDEVYCYITGANLGNNAVNGTGLGTAQATLFYYTWGYWRGTAVSLEPGDGMVASWKVPDESKITAAPGAGAAPPPPPPGGGGGGRRPAGPAGAGGGALAPSNPGPGAGGGAGNAPAAPANTPLPFKLVTKERDAFLLDVVANPVGKVTGGGSQKINFFALIRDIDKSIVAIDPEVEKASANFRRLEASVEAGLLQMRGVSTAAPGDQPQPPNNPPPLIPPAGGGRPAGG